MSPSATQAGWPTIVVSVVGPTAVGKSDLALDLAQALSGEIISADAFAVYRGMDVGTAKTPVELRRGVPHHLIDLVDTDQDYGVGLFQVQGRAALAEIASRGHAAIVVGGSGLYVRGLLDDLRFPGTEPEVRARWESVAALVGPRELHALLAARDPVAAAAILPGNTRRVVRALEVNEITGAPMSAVLPKAGPPMVPHCALGLDGAREDLDRRIAQRVDRMMSRGLVGEVESLRAHGLRRESTAGRALGYAQVLDHLEGRLSLDEAVQSTVSGTRRLARRQQRWFRADPRVTWLGPGEGRLQEALDVVRQHADVPR